ncbi:hypothetical protein AXK11_04540 [Cephaloticoccus primus]|uniref:Coproporphyrinogen III oxidase n=1 Tax=Cephaloticoccus primus TaxID=1548207 RepID=A0A139SP94_9BACT|nr:protoporphyrinogen oxidase [Cephaloticoccus primus]KXU36425.1 hypothetical protein AXK11_04540 [Cephaloticoccus primus]
MQATRPALRAAASDAAAQAARAASASAAAPPRLRKQAPTVAILGAGITGLVAAHRLAAKGIRVRLFEKTSRAGGVIRTTREGGWLVEHGPNSLLDSAPHGAALRALIAELRLESQLVYASPDAKNRYLVRGGRLVAAPTSPLGFMRTPLLSAAAKCRVVGELFRRRSKPPRAEDTSLADFVGAHFGQEVVDALLGPFVSGVYAGDPQRLSARHAFPTLWQAEQSHGSLLRAQIAKMRQARASDQPRPRLFSFRDGLQSLIDALVQSLPQGSLQLGAQVRSLTPPSSANGAWKITVTKRAAEHTKPANAASHARASDSPGAPGGSATPDPRDEVLCEELADAVICALPAHALAALQIGDSHPLATLAEIEHPPVSALFLGYRRAQIAHPLDGFGMLVPAVEKLPLLGVIFTSTLFPGRAPAGHVALHVMLGGAGQRELTALPPLPPDELLARVSPALEQTLGLQRDGKTTRCGRTEGREGGEPVFMQHQHWPRAIPQYNLGYEKHLGAMAACEARYPGLFIGGQCRGGISTPACIHSGETLAAQAAAHTPEHAF